MNYVTKEQYRQACSEDLYGFLVREHGSQVRQQYGSVLLLEDPHVSVKAGYHGYRNFRTDETGNNIDYLMNFLGYDYPGAVLALINGSGTAGGYVLQVKPSVPATREIVLPEPSGGPYSSLYACLTGRGIPAGMISELVKRGILYQSRQGNNIVFATPQKDYCEIRGTNTFADRRCRRRGECACYCPADHGWCRCMEECADYRADPFHGCRKARPDRFWYYNPGPDGPAGSVYVCESAIDAISLYLIHQAGGGGGKGSVYVSIGGAANQQAIDRLRRGAKNGHVIIAADNDAAGQECRDRNRELEHIIPYSKDWNDDLMKGDY